jgi:hypothetical protein
MSPYIDTIRDHIIKACFTSISQFRKKYANMIRTYQFAPGDLILVRNSHVEVSLDRKTKPRWIGMMVIVHQTTHRAYILAEMDGAISKLRFATFCVIPYHAQWRMNIDLETFLYSPMPMKRWKMWKMRWRRMRISKKNCRVGGGSTV